MSTILPARLAEVAQRIAKLLHERGETVSIAETAAGGLLSSSLLATPGASKVYSGGLVLYTLSSRLAYAGWTQSDIDAYRGPTVPLVQKIARNVNMTLKSTWTVCESGTAGPTGGTTRERTPGFVALAVVRGGSDARDDETGQRPGTWGREIMTGSAEREGNMLAFAVEAWKLFEDVLLGNLGDKDVQVSGIGKGESEQEKL